MTYSATTSRKALPVLKSGRAYQYNGSTMQPLREQTNQPAEIPAEIKREVKNDGNRGNTIDGRPDGKSAAAAGVQPDGNGHRGWLADWLGDDDE